MRISLLLPTLLLLTACATRAEQPPGCSGPVRPANPHGSVLAPLQQPAAAPKAGRTEAPARPAPATAKPWAMNDRSGAIVGRCVG